MSALQIDTDSVSSTGSTLSGAGWGLSTDSDLVMGGCGSAAVSAAADDWALWIKTTLLLMQGRVTSAGGNASAAAAALAAQEEELAGSTGM